jgi:plastocyanin
MILKIVVASIAIIIASIIIRDAIVGAQFLARTHSDFFGDDDAQGLGPENSAKDKMMMMMMMPVPKGEVRIIGKDGSNSYNPNPINVKVGDTVTWVNSHHAPRTVTSDQGTFDSGIVKNGQTFSHTFDKVGDYAYHCAIHPEMVGRVVVVTGN